MSVKVTFPVGRLVGGSLHESRAETEDDGKTPKYDKGGNPKRRWSFGLAVAKGGEGHWRETAWGAPIWGEGAAAFPAHVNGSRFSWKIQDGDSREPNQNGNIPAEQPGYAGCWVVWFSSMFPFSCWVSGPDGAVYVAITGEEVKPGYYIEVAGNVAGNGSAKTPGVYMNPVGVRYRGEGEVIELRGKPDPAKLGFGGALPAGARPIGLPPAVTGFAPPAPPPPPVAPAPQFLAPPPPPVAPVRRMIGAAVGHSYESLVAAGWTDALLVSSGMMDPDGR